MDVSVTHPARLPVPAAPGMSGGGSTGVGARQVGAHPLLQSSITRQSPIGKGSMVGFASCRHLSKINLISLFTKNNRCLSLDHKIARQFSRLPRRAKRP
jgi:hypothetical protein